MFNRIRQIHLFAAIVLTVFVLMYFLSGLVMIYEETFPRKDLRITEVTRAIPGIGTLSGDELVVMARENFGVRGQYQVRANNSGTVINFRHPGTEAQVVVKHGSDSVTCTLREKNLAGVVHHFHRLHGYYGGANYVAWAALYDLTAIAMIIFAFTGVYLWYKTERTRWPGWIILIFFTLLTAYTLYYLGVLH